MLPRFNDSDYVMAINLPWLILKPGHVVLVLHSSLGLIIKRIFKVESNGFYKLVGDHQSSTSSEQMGWIERNQIIGRVFYHIANNPSSVKLS
ncbi:MAG: S24/S26 family peptidase [Gammaproteobacteria bacterium]|nr:S24/S26 family peptidase [Gammaproteobacteria bacterium]